MEIPFPYSHLYDNFNRGNGNPGASYWGTAFGSQPQIASNQLIRGGLDGGVFATPVLEPNQEIWGTLTGTIQDTVFLWVRADFQVTSGYKLGLDTANNRLILWRSTSGSSTSLDYYFPPSGLSVGDKMGLRAIGSTLEVWYKTGAGAWTLLGTTINTLYSGVTPNRYAGISFVTGAAIGIDDVGLGNVSYETFPALSSTLLDDFNRPDGALGSNWTLVSGTAPVISGNKIMCSSSANGAVYLNTLQTGPDCEVWGTYTGTPAGTAIMWLTYTQDQDNGVGVSIQPGTISLSSWDSGIFSNLYAWSTPVSLSAGDQVGMRAIGGVYTVWYKPVWDLVWRPLISDKEPTGYRYGRRIGIDMRTSSTQALDDISGGSLIFTDGKFGIGAIG